MTETTACSVVRRLQEAGHVAYFAGGCVRDRLRGVPAADFDIATDATPEQVVRLFRRTVEVGAQFGVVCVLEGGAEFQVASFRADGEYIDGRHPVGVRYASPETDAQRRDFTVNGMFYDPVADRVIDYVGGRADLAARVIRAIGDPAARFAEDKLRLLRAVRFAATLDFAIDPPTWEALRAAAGTIGTVSAERIREELTRLFVSPGRVRGLDLLEASGLLGVILPEVAALRGCEQPPQFHPEGDVYVHTRLMLGLLPAEPGAALAFATLLHDIGKPPTQSVDPDGRIRFNHHEKVGADMARAVMERLRFSRAEVESVVAMVLNHMAFKDVPRMRVATLKRLMARPTYADELELHRVDCLASHGKLDNLEILSRRAEEFSREPLIPPPLVTGGDLIALGWKPGPAFKPMLDLAQTLQLEGQIQTREEALARIREEFGDAPA